ncbi:uncharacterized protein BO97DRAFT_179952 [Aspergillus homomorphus CBS 101889]|uniref:Uncharacterized protein n=1 Tax=Aspergillus homomorphus (strain CBS 101889) TaxID=1450537 RepID=A0A395ID13_ASPHC|nr:hypothetical protein BO97DRAFT_179952 [Aspergillus homomorphus CBS 101889]RAL16054.1 hypothetical protein BO97DRAFT_179952 [Aspergillus homomorphus CBS 101889]
MSIHTRETFYMRSFVKSRCFHQDRGIHDASLMSVPFPIDTQLWTSCFLVRSRSRTTYTKNTMYLPQPQLLVSAINIITQNDDQQLTQQSFIFTIPGNLMVSSGDSNHSLSHSLTGKYWVSVSDTRRFLNFKHFTQQANPARSMRRINGASNDSTSFQPFFPPPFSLSVSLPLSPGAATYPRQVPMSTTTLTHPPLPSHIRSYDLPREPGRYPDRGLISHGGGSKPRPPKSIAATLNRWRSTQLKPARRAARP